MLVGQNGGRHKYGNLLPIVHSLESGANGNLGLTKTNIPTNQSIHWSFTFHIPFDILCCLTLIWGILINKRCLELQL